MKTIALLFRHNPETRLSFNYPNQYCPLCTFRVRNVKDNCVFTEMVLTLATEDIAPGLLPCIRTLRSTKCMAPFFIFADQDFMDSVKRKAFFEQFFINCGVNFIPIPEGVTHCEKTKWEAARFPLYLKFLIQHGHLFNRFLFIDCFDLVFQGNPFTEEIRDDRVYFQSEVVTNGYLSNWITSWYNYSSHGPIGNVLQGEIINGGIQLGGVKPMIKFLQCFIPYLFYENGEPICCGDCVEQGLLNIIIYADHICEKNNITCEIMSFSETRYASLKYQMVHERQKRPIGEYQRFEGKIPNPDLGYYLILHQYDRSKFVRKSVVTACSRLYGDLDAPRIRNQMTEVID